MKKWFCLFSQTGAEIYNLSKHFRRFPDYIITNQLDDSKIFPALKTEAVNSRWIQLFPGKVSSNVYGMIFNIFEDPLITLHGWLKIVPADICNEFQIFNGHPALISEYPELKGKDPVEKLWNNLEYYNKIGSIVHQVTAGVDEGPILEEYSIPNTKRQDKNKLYEDLRFTSFQCWTKFLVGKL